MVEKKRGNARPRNLSRKMTSMSRMERGRERSVGKFPAVYPQTIPMEIPTTTHTGGKNKRVLEKKRGNARPRKLSTKMTSMSRMERKRETSVIEKGEDFGDDETSLGFAPFW